MADEVGWLSTRRPPKRGRHNSYQTTAGTIDTNGSDEASSFSSPSMTAHGGIPPSLMAHLGWTRLSSHSSSSRHERLAARQLGMRERNDGGERKCRVKVAGCAIFFIHDPPKPGNDTVWFQGRFFPSMSSGDSRSGGDSDDNNRIRRDTTPTSVLSSERSNDDSLSQSSSSTTMVMAVDSWGVLATQNAIVDECLACEEGGYRELDLTFIRRRQKSRTQGRETNDGGGSKTMALRWVACDVVWTGGNMMTLNASFYAGERNDDDDNNDVKFEPRKLLEGDAAMTMASRYFPEMKKRLHIRDIITKDDGSHSSSSLSSRHGKRIRSTSEEDEEWGAPMIIIGDMEVMAPSSFVTI